MREVLSGAYDMHIHTSPDVVKRKCSDIELAKRLIAAGMKGCCIKNHYFETATRAKLLQEQFPQLRVFGGVTLNRSVGGINPDVVERIAQAGGQIVWFPTMDARAYKKLTNKNSEVDFSIYLTVAEDGKLKKEVIEVLEVAAAHHMIVGTGHLGTEEGMLLVRTGIQLGCKILLTHANSPLTHYSIDQQREAVHLGALVEYSLFPIYHKGVSVALCAEQIRTIGCENVILSTDFGQINSPYADEGIEIFAKALLKEGITEEELHMMLCKGPDLLWDFCQGK